MTEQEEQQLVENVKSLTDRLTIVDQVLKKHRLGQSARLVFRCGESGLLYPADYIKQWGKLYGIGLGPHPVSESLQSDYDTAPPPITVDTRRFEDIMHPLYSSCSQMDSHLVTDEEWEESQAILAIDDPHYVRRAPVLREKQLVNDRSRLRNMAVAWERAGKR